MNGDIQSPQQNRLHQDIAENVTLKSHRSKLREATEFESITAAEPMEEYAPPRPPLRLVFEDHGGTTAQEVEELSSTSTKSTRDSFKKKTSFAERPQVVNLSHEELVRLAKPEVMDYMDQDAERSLSEQLENCSVSTHSVYSEEGNDETEEHQPPDAGARLEQITTRIFVTLLPDDETPEQRHCDLLQAQTRLYDLTNGSKVLVVNCGEVNTQIMTIFPLIQNCPFDLDGYPDLATFIAFCERVHDWLLLSSTHVLLLHAEGVAAQTRLLLLLRSLSSYYETNERYDPTTSRMLRQYITSYPNGKLLSPVAWLRYSGLMRLFSPENSLGILRATVGIYNLAFYNFPVFEENKLRLFIKFYSGFPLRHMYTTSIHDFSSTNACNIIIRFVNDTDSSSSNVGLRLQGNISLIAYHCRPYPARRLRLFRLHLHSCQCIVGPLTFQKDDFDDLCDAFPSTMRMELHTTNRNPSTSVRVDVREERISPNSAFGESTTTGFPGSTSTPVKNHLSDPMSPDNAVRLHDSLENLNFHSAGDRRMTRYVSFSRFETLDGLIQLTGQHTLGQVNLHRLSLPPVEEHCGTYDTLAYDNTEIKGSEEPYGQPEMSPRKKRIHNIFSSTRRKTYKEATTDIIADSDLMPPPSEPLVPRKGHKRKYNVGQRLLKFLASKGGALEVPDTDKMESPEVSDLGISEGSSEESSSTSSLLNLFTRLRYRQAEHSTHSSSHKSGPPKKTRKVVTVDEMNRQIVTSVPVRPTTEDLLEAARRLNFMAGTQELDRLLEELRLTSLQMSSGLPPPSAPYSPKPYNVATHGSHTSSYRQNSSVHTHGRYNTTRSSSTIGLYGSHDPQTPNLTSPTGYNYQKRSVYHTERRLDGLTRPAHYPVLRSSMSPAPTPRHHTTYTTVLKQRPPMGPRQLSQVHLTIDPECGATDTSISNGRDISSREQRLEAELNSARQELAQLRRAISLVEERHRQEYNREVRTPVSPAHIPQTRSPLSGQNQFLSNTSSSYQTQHFGSRSTSSTFQRTTSPRQEGIYGAGFPLSKRAMSHTNVQSTRSWNLRSQNYRQGSETDLSVKTTTSASNQPGRSGYSAHRERLRQERERELLLRQQQKRQLAASSTGLNEQLHQQNRQQQQYRSLSAVNTPAVSEAVEEIETVVLQFIGRGVQDVDSQVGSMTTLPRGRGGSMMDGLQSVDSSQRGGLAKRGFSSTQFLARNNSNSDLVKPMPMHQSQTMISPSPQPLQASRFNTSATLVNHSQATVLLNGSRGHLSPTNSTAAPTTTTPVITNGWKVDGSVKQTFVDRGQDNGNLGIVQDTAPSWYRPKLSREAAINILRQQPPGNFLIRDSTTFKGAYGLAVKVATLPPKVTQKSDDLQSELVRHYLIEVVNTPIRGVRLKGFASEPVFPSLAALIHQHTIDPLALPCRLILPPVPTNLPSSGSATLPPLVIGTMKHASAVEDGAMPDNVTVASSGSVRGAPPSEVGSLHTDGPVGPPHRMDGIAQMPIQVHDNPVPSHNVPYVCVVREGSSPQRRSPLDITGNQGLTFRCLMLGSVDTPQWSSELCFARAVDQLIPLTLLTASECDHGVSRVRYTEVQLHVSAHDGITIIDLQRRLFLRRHLPNHVLLYCGLESRKKEFSHPEHQTQGLVHPKIFGIVVRKGISECTTHVFSELDRAHMADYIVKHVRATYPHMNIR